MKNSTKKPKLYISKELEWLRPFVEASASIVDLSKIKAIKAYKSKTAFSDGGCTTSGKKFLITIRSHYYDVKSKQYQEEPKGQILDTLAHELCHSVNEETWDHTVTHFDLQTRILRKYVPILRRTKIELWPN